MKNNFLLKTKLNFLLIVKIFCLTLLALCFFISFTFVNLSSQVVAETNSITRLDGYEVESSVIDDNYKYARYTKKNSSNVQTQSMYYGEVNLSPTATKKYKLIEHSIQSKSGGFTLHSVMDLAKDYELQSGNKVIFGVNGTFFRYVDNQIKPNFAAMRNGELIKQDTWADWIFNTGLGWNENSEVVLGEIKKNKMSVQLDDGKDRIIFTINKKNVHPRRGENAIITTGSVTVKDSFNAYKIPIINTYNRDLRNENDQPMNFTSLFGGVATKINTPSLTVGKNEFYIITENKSKLDKQLANFKGNCNFIPTPGGAFENITSFIGGNNTLVRDSVVQDISLYSSHESQLCARTTIGFKNDGAPFLVVTDGRQPGYATGINVKEQAIIAGALGAKTAVELDGGGSSTFIFRKDNKLEMMNTPDDKDDVGRPEARVVVDAVLLVEVPSSPTPDPDPTPTPDPTPDPIPTPDPDPKPDPTTPPPKNNCNSSLYDVSGLIFVSSILLFLIIQKRKA